MDVRTKSILLEGVRDFIKSGRPITSGTLFENYNFGIKPAMIRRELSVLDSDGFLEQVHSSGGRVPTNEAYRFFAEELIRDKELISRAAISRGREMLSVLMRGNHLGFTKHLSEYLKLLGVVYSSEAEEFFNSGLTDLFENLEPEEARDFIDIANDFESLQSRIEEDISWWNRSASWPQVFVGKSPITRSRNLAVVVEKISSDQGNYLVVAIGPKRMDYEKSIGLFKSFKQRANDQR